MNRISMLWDIFFLSTAIIKKEACTIRMMEGNEFWQFSNGKLIAKFKKKKKKNG